MTRKSAFIKALIVLSLVWAAVWGVRTFADSRKVTAERLNQRIERAKFEDWSGRKGVTESPEAKRRVKEITGIADMVNGLDFQEREKNRSNRSGEDFFRKLSGSEKNLFIDLTIMESMDRFMEALDSMPADQRKRFVERGLKDLKQGRTQKEMDRADELGSELLDKISQEGMRAYFEKSSADTKLDLAPLMEAVNETMQGLRGNEFGPRR